MKNLSGFFNIGVWQTDGRTDRRTELLKQHDAVHCYACRRAI